MTRIEQQIREGAPQGLQITIWPTAGGAFQANVKMRASDGWACWTHEDPLLALAEALRFKLQGAGHTVSARQEPEQIDIEEAIAAAAADADDFEGLL